MTSGLSVAVAGPGGDLRGLPALGCGMWVAVSSWGFAESVFLALESEMARAFWTLSEGVMHLLGDLFVRLARFMMGVVGIVNECFEG